MWKSRIHLIGNRINGIKDISSQKDKNSPKHPERAYFSLNDSNTKVIQIWCVMHFQIICNCIFSFKMDKDYLIGMSLGVSKKYKCSKKVFFFFQKMLFSWRIIIEHPDWVWKFASSSSTSALRHSVTTFDVNFCYFVDKLSTSHSIPVPTECSKKLGRLPLTLEKCFFLFENCSTFFFKTKF